jgi:hypothetical protein
MAHRRPATERRARASRCATETASGTCASERSAATTEATSGTRAAADRQRSLIGSDRRLRRRVLQLQLARQLPLTLALLLFDLRFTAHLQARQ